MNNGIDTVLTLTHVQTGVLALVMRADPTGGFQWQCGQGVPIGRMIAAIGALIEVMHRDPAMSGYGVHGEFEWQRSALAVCRDDDLLGTLYVVQSIMLDNQKALIAQAMAQQKAKSLVVPGAAFPGVR